MSFEDEVRQELEFLRERIKELQGLKRNPRTAFVSVYVQDHINKLESRIRELRDYSERAA